MSASLLTRHFTSEACEKTEMRDGEWPRWAPLAQCHSLGQPRPAIMGAEVRMKRTTILPTAQESHTTIQALFIQYCGYAIYHHMKIKDSRIHVNVKYLVDTLIFKITCNVNRFIIWVHVLMLIEGIEAKWGKCKDMEYGNSEGQSCIYIFQDSLFLHVEMPQGHITCHKLYAH